LRAACWKGWRKRNDDKAQYSRKGGPRTTVEEQYRTAGNLEARIALHRDFSANPQGWACWVAAQYDLRPGMAALELGCGNGLIWRARTEELPHGLRLVLSDRSTGMLETARKNTQTLANTTYQVIDAQEIPYPDHSFDAVMANHMLYHVPDLPKALGEIARVLKPGGVLYATTLGRENLRELWEILAGFDPEIDWGQSALAEVFGLETGGAKLAPYFSEVELRRYPDHLHVTRAQPLADYVLSQEGVAARQGEAFAQYLEEIIARRGAIDIRKDAGMFLARK
jgi:SAM-dependent methyltransferase